ncbi:MAG TPA: ester cyclase [Candidatus Binataceae bacterium]|nr:ester cyclase [Candidatus Binataceae bacterium]
MGQLQEANINTIRAYRHAAFDELDFDRASQYLAPSYLQHSPGSPDGTGGLKHFIELLKTKFPRHTHKDHRYFADGDYVICHSHFIRVPGTPGSAVIDIYRMADGKVVEHWDVIQELPEKPANNNGAF